MARVRSRAGTQQPDGRASRTRRHPPEVRRALIIEAAREFIAERGLAATTAREVAARCEISTGTLTHHFASMDELLVEVLRESSETFTGRLLAGVDGEATAWSRLYYLIEAPLPESAGAAQQFRLWLEYWARAAHHPALAAAHRERYRVWRGAIESVIAEGVRDGEFRKVDSHEAAREIVALLDGLSLQAVIGDEEVGVDEARRILRRAVEARLSVER